MFKSLRDIPQMTRVPNYHVNVSMDSLIDHVDRYVSEYACQLDPDFQRGHVWDTPKQIAYIEFVLRGGQLSKDFKFNMPNWIRWKADIFDDSNCMVLVDGKQRLEAVRRFMNNEIPAYGKTLDCYEDHSFLRRVYFDIYVNDLPTRKDVLQWYLDLNTGGVVHTDEEIAKVQELLKKA